MNYLIYDCEIIKAIPGPGPDRLPSISYCQGWGDFGNMGVSVIGYSVLRMDGGCAQYDEPKYLIGDCYGLRAFERLAEEMRVIGFNSASFDDRLMTANGVSGVTTTYDLLEEVRRAACGSIDYRDVPTGRSYRLAAIGEANGYPKTGDGANAAIDWQQGRHHEVIEYCINDVRITAELLILGLKGKLKDPNTGVPLKLRPLE